MESLYLWPARPAASLLVLWLFSQLFCWAARVPVHRAFRALGRVLGGAFRITARWCRSVAVNVAKRDRGRGNLSLRRAFARVYTHGRRFAKSA